MALVECRECKRTISSEAKICPNCGIKDPYKPTWKDLSPMGKFFSIAFTVLVGISIIVYYAQKEERLLAEVQDIKSNDVKGKYDAYEKLFEIDNKSAEYKRLLVQYGESYLKKIPVTLPEKNLGIYRTLNKAKPTEKYQNKIAFYNQMNSLANSCRLKAMRDTKKLATNPATYEQGYQDAKFDSSTEYLIAQNFSAKNAFGVESKKRAGYVCVLNYKNNTFSLIRLSMTNQ